MKIQFQHWVNRSNKKIPVFWNKQISGRAQITKKSKINIEKFKCQNHVSCMTSLPRQYQFFILLVPVLETRPFTDFFLGSCFRVRTFSGSFLVFFRVQNLPSVFPRFISESQIADQQFHFYSLFPDLTHLSPFFGQFLLL